MSNVLTAADILAAEDIKTVDVEVKEWGGIVRLRSLSAEEAIRFVQENSQSAEEGNQSSVEIVALCAVDENGDKLFTAEQVKQLRKKSFRAILKIQDEALRINGMKEDSAGAAKND